MNIQPNKHTAKFYSLSFENCVDPDQPASDGGTSLFVSPKPPMVSEIFTSNYVIYNLNSLHTSAVC